MSDDPTHIAWLDLETTCSDENLPYAAIIEVGVYVTNYYLEPVASTSVVLNPGLEAHLQRWAGSGDLRTATVDETVATVFDAMDPVVQDMHTANGLWDEVVKSDWTRERVDTALAEFLAEVGDGSRVALAGSGVGHFDSRWLTKFTPKTKSKLTYWSFDVGVMRRFLRDLCGVAVEEADPAGLSGDGDRKLHRALDDAKAHLEEARVYVDSLRGHAL